MINFGESIQRNLGSGIKVMGMQKKVSCFLDIKLTINEWIKSILKIMLECKLSKLTKSQSELG